MVATTKKISGNVIFLFFYQCNGKKKSAKKGKSLRLKSSMNAFFLTFVLFSSSWSIRKLLREYLLHQDSPGNAEVTTTNQDYIIQRIGMCSGLNHITIDLIVSYLIISKSSCFTRHSMYKSIIYIAVHRTQ